ncbi:hypothetical protein ACJVV8_04510 [Staphylococcus pseudintermedius]|uniref:hypothetical protein n=1 Tax=Staphylococcus pseudintermedius TaxID=283734 RepID=UPI002932114D|nr:hypothetical protein [Staphylococcus pseudintermedius]ELP8661667.1 hypothetical protein [Staphylococcus pseudintermedius]
MDYFERYKKVNTSYGITLSQHVIEASRQSAARSFYSSPTLTDIKVNGEKAKSVVSIYQKDFFDRTFLFPPDSEHAKIGNYIEHRNYTYLVMRSNDNDIYPNLYGKLCNEDFKLPTEKKKVKVKGHNGAFTYKYEYEYESIPIVVDVKGYSISDNAILPLTEGRVIIYMRYESRYLNHVTLNYEFELFNDTYKITDIQLDKVVGDEGYIALSAQKAVENEYEH